MKAKAPAPSPRPPPKNRMTKERALHRDAAAGTYPRDGTTKYKIVGFLLAILPARGYNRDEITKARRQGAESSHLPTPLCRSLVKPNPTQQFYCAQGLF